MKLPKKITIGPFLYDITEITGDRENELSTNYGRLLASKQVIEIYSSHGDQRTAETLIHEIFHAIYETWDIKDEDNEERTVTALAYGLATVMKDNPDLMPMLSSALGKVK